VAFEQRAPTRLHSVTVVASQRAEEKPDPGTLGAMLRERLIGPVLAVGPPALDEETRVFINPEGPVIGGGPALASNTFSSFSTASSSTVLGNLTSCSASIRGARITESSSC
jgi:hypothetical protein